MVSELTHVYGANGHQSLRDWNSLHLVNLNNAFSRNGNMFCLSVIRLVFYLFPSSLKVNKKIIKGRICFSVIWFRFLVVMEYTLETH